MTTAQSTLLQLAKRGDAKAIADVLNQALSTGITAKVSLKESCLKVMLDSIEAPDQTTSSELVRNVLNGLNSAVIHQVKIYGRELGEDCPSWQEEFSFSPKALPDIRELAQKGDIEAIKTLIAPAISQPDVAIKVSLKNGCLRILLEANEFANQSTLIDSILNEIQALQIQDCKQLKISGREPGDEFPDWQQEFELSHSVEEFPHSSEVGNSVKESPSLDSLLSEIEGLQKQSYKENKITGIESGNDSLDWQVFDPFQSAEARLPVAMSDEVELHLTKVEFEQNHPSQSQSNLLELARKGDTQAITTVMNYLLKEKGLTVAATLKGGCLLIVLQAEQIPEQEQSVTCVRKILKELKLNTVQQVKLYGRRKGSTFTAWTQDLNLAKSQQEGSLWGSVFGAVTGAVEAVGSAASYAGGTVVGVATGAVGAVGNAASYTGGAVVGTVTGATEAVGSAASYAGGTVVGAATGAVEAAGNAATQTGEAITGTVFGVAGAIGNSALQATDGVGHALSMIADSPQLQGLTKTLKADWLLAIIDRVDIDKAEAQVRKLQQKYPKDKPSDIAHRIMMEKALYVGGTGFASSLAPGWATAMFAVDLAATMAVQAEMIYQIASAYGLNLHEPGRKGEVLAIFGVALGGSTAIKAGLGLLRNVPGAGAVIGASSNAAMLYALGYAACKFYEAKLGSSTSPADFTTSQAASDQYLQDVLNQQVIMDQILVHLVLAGKPGKTWQQSLPELKALNLSPAFLDSIAGKSKNLPPLNQLLNQLNQDFSVSLLAQCRKIAQADGKITPQEAKIIGEITQKFSLL